MGLLLAMGKVYGRSGSQESKDLVIPFARPEIQEESSAEDTVSRESNEYPPEEAEESVRHWHPFPDANLMSEARNDDDLDDFDENDSESSSFTEESSTCIGDKVEKSIMEQLGEVEALTDKALDVVRRIPTSVEITAGLLDDILNALAEAKYAAEEWMSIFQQACQMVSLGNKVNDSALQPTVVHLGIKLCMAMECLRMWMSNGHQGGQTEIRVSCSEILRLLNLIPRGNLDEHIQNVISMLHSGSAAKLHTSVDFQMPSQSTRRIRDVDGHDSGTSDYTPGHIEALGLNSRRTSVHRHAQNLNSVMLSGGEEGEISGLALESPKKSILKQSITIDNVDIDILANRSKDSSSSASESSETSPRHLPVAVLESRSSSLSFAVHRAHGGNAKKTRARPDLEGPIDFSEGAELCGAIPEEEDMIAAVAKFKMNPRLTEEQIKKCDFSKIYKDTRVLRRDAALTIIEDPLEENLADRHEKWTYQLLVESKPLMKYCRIVLNDFRSQQEQFYQKTAENHIFEWCLLVDNSGSMITKSNQAAEALVLAIETFRRLECPFAIARFGGKKSQRMLKTFDQTFSNGLGQQILDSFSYDEATHPASAVANVAAKVWPYPIDEKEKGVRHRVMLMIVDGLTQEKNPADYTEVTKEREVDLVVLNLKDGMQESVMQQIEKLWDSVASCYEVLDVELVDDLPFLLAGLVIKQFDKMLKDATKCRALQERGDKNFQPDILSPKLAKKIDVGILKSVGKLTYRKGKDEGAGGTRQPSMFQIGNGNEEIPFLDQARDVPRVEKNDALVETAIDKTHDFYSVADSDEALHGVIKEAQSMWGEAAGRVGGQIDSMVEALEECLPVNVYTRNKASERGTSLHLQGLIKAVTTKFNYKKYFSAKKSGGKRQYAVTIVVDISMSMGGHLAQCSVEALVMFVEGLLSMDIENFTVLLFGSGLYVVKLPDTPWDGASIAALLSNLRHDREYASLDADAIECALSLFQATNPKGPRKIFIISDGFSTSGIRLAQALERAEEELVEVLAIGVGFDKFFVPHCYNRWLTAVLPCAIPDALKVYHEQGSAQGSGHRLNVVDDCEDWSQFAPVASDATESTEEILRHHKTAFPDLLEKLRGERSVKLKTGNRPSVMTVDICFVLDSTGSMGPWIAAAKSQILAITGGIVPKINKDHPGIRVELRFAMVAYKDHGDADRMRVLQFTEKVEELHMFLQSLTAEGGQDGPEDVLGALATAARLDDWEGRVKFVVLIADAPAHGRDCNDDPHDRFPQGDPTGLTVQPVMEKLLNKKLELMFCRIKAPATAMMEAQFRNFYEDQKIGRELTTTDLFDPSKVPVGIKGFHFVFCLDESGSMCGQPWQDLVNAYNLFIHRRLNDQGCEDLVTVIQFDSSPRLIFTGRTIGSQPGLAAQRGGGTLFTPALDLAQSYLLSHPHLTPLLVFMSDGGDNYGLGVEPIKEAYRNCRHRGLEVHTVAFGCGASHGLLKEMAEAANGQDHQAIDGIQLSRVFIEIAARCSAMDGLVSRFGEIISGMVANRIVLDHL